MSRYSASAWRNPNPRGRPPSSGHLSELALEDRQANGIVRESIPEGCKIGPAAGKLEDIQRAMIPGVGHLVRPHAAVVLVEHREQLQSEHAAPIGEIGIEVCEEDGGPERAARAIHLAERYIRLRQCRPSEAVPRRARKAGLEI